MDHKILAKQTLFLTLGLPGSGKSHVSRQLASSLDLSHVNTDRIRTELFENPVRTTDEDTLVLRIAEYMVIELLEAGRSVVLDGDMTMRKTRLHFERLSKENGVQPITLWVQTDEETAFVRSTRRNGKKKDDEFSKNIDVDTFNRITERLRRPTTEKTVVVSGKHLFKIQLSNIMRKLQTLNMLTMTERPLKKTPQRQTVAGRVAPKPRHRG